MHGQQHTEAGVGHNQLKQCKLPEINLLFFLQKDFRQLTVSQSLTIHGFGVG